MSIETDFSVSAAGAIRYIGAAHGASGAGYHTGLALHRWLQTKAMGASAAGDDYMAINFPTPTKKKFDTIIELLGAYNIDDTAAEHLYDCSIIQAGGDVIYDAVQVIAAPGCHVEVVQNGALVANDFWNTIPFGSSDKGLNPDAARGVCTSFLLKVRTGGADIDGRRFIAQTREDGYSHSEFRVPGTSRGINVVPLTYLPDLNNQTALATVATWTDITLLTEGYALIDANADSTDEAYYGKWDRGSRSIGQFYERIKYLTRRGSSSTLYGLNGELFRGITHEVNVDTPTGTFNAFEAISWSGGTGQMLAINSPTAATKLWMQLLTGVAPTDNQTITGGTSGATCLVNVTVTQRDVPQKEAKPACGQSTGSALIGAYGFGIEAADLGINDRVRDLTDAVITPPNIATYTVSGLVSGDDYIMVGPEDGAGSLDETQFTLNGALSGAAVTSVVVNEAIPADTPATGVLRILRASGGTSRHPYSAYNAGTKTFTITSADFSSDGAANGAGAYIGYIDKLADATTASFQAQYSADRSLFIRRRFAGTAPDYTDATETFEAVGTFGASGGSITVQRASDA